MTNICDLDTPHRLLVDATEEAAGWLRDAGAFLQASAVLAGLTGALDLLGWLPRGFETDHQIDVLLLVFAQELFWWGRRWVRLAPAAPGLLTAHDDA